MTSEVNTIKILTAGKNTQILIVLISSNFIQRYTTLRTANMFVPTEYK